MDYEKKDFRKLYEDLVKSDWFKRAYHNKSLGECPFDIPELAESEDEKMINELQGFLDSFGADDFGTGEWQKFHDWLEKQKESLHISETCKENPNSFTNEDERIRKFLLDHAIEMIAGLESDISFSTYDGIKGHDPEAETELAQWQKARAYLEKQKEQKPSDPDVKGRRGRIGNTPEHIRKKAENFLSKMEPPYDADDICSAYETGAMESIKLEWSEEDETCLEYALWCVMKTRHFVAKDVCDLDACQRAERWLKSLRPSWKPSEEQKSVAERFARIVRGNLIGIDEEVQQKFEQLYFEVTGNKMYRGYND